MNGTKRGKRIKREKSEDQLLKIMKRRLKLIFLLSLTMISCLMGIIIFGIQLNKDYQDFNIEMRDHVYYSKQMTKIAFDLNAMQYDDSNMFEPYVKDDVTSMRLRLMQLLGQIDKEIHLLSQRGGKFDSPLLFDQKNMEAFQQSVTDLKIQWEPFRKAILAVADGDDKQRLYGIHYIEENYDALYLSSDEVAQQAAELSKQRDLVRIIVSSVLLITAFFAVFVQFIYIFRQVILPLESVYNEMKQVGVSKRMIEIEKNSRNKHVYPIIQEINYKLQKLNWLISTIQNINKNESFNDVLQYMYTSFSTFIPLNHIGIALIDEDNVTASFAYSISDDAMKPLTAKLLSNTMHIDHKSLQMVLATEKPIVINNLEASAKCCEQDHYNQVLFECGVNSLITIPLKINNNAIGFVLFSSNKSNAYNEEHAQYLEVLADSISLSFNKNIYINEILYGNSLALAKLAESRDQYTGEHLARIKTYSRMIAQFLSTDSRYIDLIDYQFIKDIEKYSELHDIGKVAIEDAILLKPGKLTEEEFEKMKKHTIYGGRVLREADASIKKGQSKIFQMGIEIAECHHEKWNGSGYPNGLKGDAIPISARIVSVADVFDALTSVRPYKKAMSFEEAYKILMDGRGVSFDPEIIDIMIKFENEFRVAHEGYYVQINALQSQDV